MTGKQKTHISELVELLDEHWAKRMLFTVLQDMPYKKATDLWRATILRWEMEKIKKSGKSKLLTQDEAEAELEKIKDKFKGVDYVPIFKN